MGPGRIIITHMENKIIHSDPRRPFREIREFLGEPNDDITIFVPYINTKTLNELLPQGSKKITLITSWKIQDIWFGSSSLDLYRYTRDKEIDLYINNRIHLKVFMQNWERCILGSANLTEKGLGISSNYNYELGAGIIEVDVDTLIYLKKILADSVLMTDKLFNRYKEQIDDLPVLPKVPDFNIEYQSDESDFLISSLPMTKDIETLFLVYSRGYEECDNETKQCAVHDIVHFKIPTGLVWAEFNEVLQQNFFRSAFVNKLTRYIDIKPRYFGEIKLWIQENCKSVPVPSRRDLTGNVQVLYRWVTELSMGKYLVDRPNHSERIYRNENES